MNSEQQAHFEALYQQHVDALTRQGKATSTIVAYSHSLRRITQFYDQCPDSLTLAQVKDYFCSLVNSHSWSTVRVDRSGLQFFYKHVLGREWQWVHIVKPPRVKTLPDILTVEEIERLINGARELRYQTFILVAYSMGLRISEALNLSVGDIDSARMKVHVRLGKGKKDRLVTLPHITLIAMRRYWATHRHPKLIFPGGKTSADRRGAIQCMDYSGVQRSLRVIVKDCGINKHITPHNLRHCYGAHLVEAGLNLRTIQQEMGHECPKTTALYTQLTDEAVLKSEVMINTLVNRLNLHWQGEV